MPLYSARSCAHVFPPKLYPYISRIGFMDESPAGPRRSLPSPIALEWPWSYSGQSTAESGGDALKTECVTGAPVQCPKLCPCISSEVVPLYFIRSCARIFHEFDSRTRVKQALNASSHPPQPWSGLVATLLVNLLWSLGAMRSRRDA